MDYGAINAKVGSMKGNLLKYEDFYLLCNFSKVDDMQIKLKDYSAYSKIDISDNGNFSKNRKIDFTDDFCKIINFINDYNIKKYLRTVLFLFEAEIIKKIVQNSFNGQNFCLTERERHFLSSNDTQLDIQSVLEAKSLKELINSFWGSKFYYILKDASDRNVDYMGYGIALERYCFQEIEQAKKINLSKEDAKSISKINGTSFDMQNIIRLMKYKKYNAEIMDNINLNTNATFAYSFLIPLHYKLKETEIKILSQTKNYNELIQYIESLYYGRYLGQPPDKMYYNAMKEVLKKLPGKSSLVPTLDYLFKKYYEIKNLNVIFEGIKYHMPQEKILELLYIS